MFFSRQKGEEKFFLLLKNSLADAILSTVNDGVLFRQAERLRSNPLNLKRIIPAQGSVDADRHLPHPGAWP